MGGYRQHLNTAYSLAKQHTIGKACYAQLAYMRSIRYRVLVGVAANPLHSYVKRVQITCTQAGQAFLVKSNMIKMLYPCLWVEKIT
jgi:hypothetical protein